MKQLVLAIFALFMFTGCDPFNTQFERLEEANYFKAKKIIEYPETKTLKVMSYNIKFGGGRVDMFFDCHGDRVIMTEEEVNTHLKNLAKFITAQDPDIIFIQEIDIDSKRSAYSDQIQYLLDNTKLNYGVYASQWKASYVPSGGKKWVGKVNSGNLILSKQPLNNGIRIALPLIEEHDWLTKYFYLKRNILVANIEIDGKKVYLAGTHLSAFAHDGTKKKQLDIVYNKAKEFIESGESLILAGDFNTLPPYTQKRGNFDDSACEGQFNGDDYSGEEEYMRPYYSLLYPAIPLETYKANNAPFYSYTSLSSGFWNRKIDYIFTNLAIKDGKVIQDGTMALSDHAPLSATITIK